MLWQLKGHSRTLGCEGVLALVPLDRRCQFHRSSDALRRA